MSHGAHPIGRRRFLGGAAVAVMATACTTVPPLRLASKTMHLLRAPDGVAHADFAESCRKRLAGWAANDAGVTMVVLHDLEPGRKHPLIPTLDEIPRVDAMVESYWEGVPRSADIPWPEHAERLDLVIDESVAVTPAKRGHALIGMLYRRAGWSHEQFVAEWFGVHGAAAGQVPRVEGLILNAIEEAAGTEAGAGSLQALASCDGIAQSYRDDPTAPLSSPEAKAWYEHGAATFGRLVSFRSKETVIKP